VHDPFGGRKVVRKLAGEDERPPELLRVGDVARGLDEAREVCVRDRVALDLLKNDLEGNLVGGVWTMQLQLGILRIQV